MTDLLLQLAQRASNRSTAADLFDSEIDLGPFPPVTQEECAEAAARLGVQLPESVRRVYMEIANGGFGPGYGLVGLITGARLDTGGSAISLYEVFRENDPEDPLWSWPAGLLPVCHWGCAIYSCVDCTQVSAPVLRFDPNGHELGASWHSAFRLEARSFEDWLRRWTTGTLPFELEA